MTDCFRLSGAEGSVGNAGARAQEFQCSLRAVGHRQAPGHGTQGCPDVCLVTRRQLVMLRFHDPTQDCSMERSQSLLRHDKQADAAGWKAFLPTRGMHHDTEPGMSARPVLPAVNPHVWHAFIHLSGSVPKPARTIPDDPKFNTGGRRRAAKTDLRNASCTESPGWWVL